MAFGRIASRRKKRKKRKAKAEQTAIEHKQNIEESQDLGKIGEDYQNIQQTANDLDAAGQQKRDEDRQRNKDNAYEDVHTKTEGLDPEARRSMQESGNAQINSQVKNYQRNIASTTGNAGIRGGAAAAPQVALAEKGLGAQNQLERDLNDKDSDVAMKRLGAFLASMEGKNAEDVLRSQGLQDFITSERDKRRNNVYTDKHDKDYIGV